MIFQTTLAMFAGGCIYAAVHYSWLGLSKPRTRQYIIFALMNIFASLFILFKLAAYHSVSAEELVLYRRLEIGSALIFFAILPWFVADFCNLSFTNKATALSTVWASCFLLNLFMPHGISYTELPALKFVNLPWNETIIDLRQGENRIFSATYYVMIFNLFYLIGVCFRQRKHNSQRAYHIIIALSVFLLFVILNKIINLSLINAPQIPEFGFIAMILLMSAYLSEELNSNRKQLTFSEARFRILVEQARDGIFLHDINGQIIDVNQQACDSLGYTRHELLGMNVADFEIAITPEHKHQLWNDMYAGTTITVEGRHRRKDGSVFPVEARIGLFRSNNHNQALAIVRDISERKRAEMELLSYRGHLEELVEQRTQELDAANKELESFSYSVSHDLRAPLRSIDGFAHALQEEAHDVLNKDCKEHLKRIRNNIQRMRNLIDGLLELSRCCRESFKPDNINLSNLAQDILLQFRASDPQRLVTIKITAGLTAFADVRLMQIALTNLLSNAWKYTSKQDEGFIEFSQQRVNDETIFIIHDNGTGFDMRFADKLFIPFQRLHGSEFPGTGIGLTTVQRIIHRHGGKIWAESEPGKGAHFYFTLNESTKCSIAPAPTHQGDNHDFTQTIT